MLLSRMSGPAGVGTIEYNPLIDCRYSVDQLKKEYDKAYYAISLHSAVFTDSQKICILLGVLLE